MENSASDGSKWFSVETTGGGATSRKICCWGAGGLAAMMMVQFKAVVDKHFDRRKGGITDGATLRIFTIS